MRADKPILAACTAVLPIYGSVKPFHCAFTPYSLRVSAEI
jgi:hypothetical protein